MPPAVMILDIHEKPGSLHHNAIGSHNIGYAQKTYPCIPPVMISTTYTILMLRMDRKCKFCKKLIQHKGIFLLIEAEWHIYASVN